MATVETPEIFDPPPDPLLPVEVVVEMLGMLGSDVDTLGIEGVETLGLVKVGFETVGMFGNNGMAL